MITKNKDYMTTAEVAELLGFSHAYIRRLITKKKLKGERIGNIWVVERKFAEKVQRIRFPRQKK